MVPRTAGALSREPRRGDAVPRPRRRPEGRRGTDAALRALDLAIGSTLAVALLPLMAAVGLSVRLSSRGPILHRAEVVGRRGSRFVWRKFRTMRVGADDGRHREAARSFISGSGRTFGSSGVFKLQDDDRITPLGRVLRRHSLDELPQLWDVLRGRMSLVGPRPCLPYEWELYSPAHRRRLDVTPGLSGLWQVLGRSRVDFHEMVVLDRCWAIRRSVALYLWVLARSVRVVLVGAGGY